MEGLNLNNIPKFKNPEEELAFLREHIAKKESELSKNNESVNKESITHSIISEYKKIEPVDILDKNFISNEKHHQEILLRLKPESHDSKMEELLGVLLSEGISNALSLVKKMKNPHLDDDFSRFLVEYLHSTHTVPGLKEGTPLFKALDITLFEISLPDHTDNPSEKKPLKELLSSMEQFYAGMYSVGEDRQNHQRNYFTMELAIAEGSENFVFYVAVPSQKANLFEKHLLGIHPDAKISVCVDDYNIFHEGGEIAGSVSELSNYEVFPIKTYDVIDHDPLNIILNVFSKIKKTREGAAIQICVRPEGDELVKRYNNILKDVKDGMSVKDSMSLVRQVGKEFMNITSELFFGSKDKKEEKKINEFAVNAISEKVKSTIMSVNIRVMAASDTKQKAVSVLKEIESAFNQFTQADQNGFHFTEKQGDDLAILSRDFSYRMFDEKKAMPLNLKELSTVFHFPYGIGGNPQLKQSKSAVAPAPIEMGSDGVILGHNNYRGEDKNIYFAPEDRVRHMYVIGQTGTGKTTIMKNMIAQDIRAGHGVCYIDPHGTDIQDILSYIPPERLDDVIYFDPAYTARPMGLNMLEFDPKYPEQKTFVVNELMGIFNKLFDMKTSGGPMFEQYFKNSAFLVMEHPESGNTLLEIGRVLSDKAFRDMKLEHCKNPIIKQFWINAEQTTGDQSLANFVPYLTSKFDNFISNDIMRPVVLQEKSVFNFREIMDNKKILLVNLSKGRLGEINANLIGMLIVGKIQMATLSRVDMYGQKMNDFYLYIDEFQNVTTDAIESILSEARKYRLSLTVAHQYISQLDEKIKNAVFGNVGSMAVFRVGAEDAEFLESKFKPVFSAKDIMQIDNRNAYMAMLVNGQPTKPFNIATFPPPQGDFSVVEGIKELSYLKYGRDREEVENEIMAKYEKS
jgi:hypothetical protein